MVDFGYVGNPWEDIRKKTPVDKVGTGILGGVGIGASTAWNALGTTGKVGVGLLGGYLAGSFFGSSKKQEQTQSQPFAPQNQSQPIVVQPVVVQPNTPVTDQYDYSQMFNTISNSPGASISAKKGSMGQTAPFTPAQNVPFAISPTQSASQQGTQGQSQGTDWATLAAIASVALVAYGYVSRKGK